MTEDKSEPLDIEKLFELIRPPATPDEVCQKHSEVLSSITPWKKLSAAATVAGLMTELSLHTYGVRLDWLQRIILSYADGKRKPTAKDISRVLNNTFRKAGILRLEDPVEDFFCDVIPTSKGDHLIFTGHWEKAAPYTQTVLEAFERLPNAQIKSETLESVFALLTLSTALARRSKVERRSFQTSQPGTDISLPSNDRAKALARRVRFTKKDLSALGISTEALTPFILQERYYRLVSDRIPGDTPLEAFPLLPLEGGVLVASPGGISQAVRFLMLHEAKAGGMEGRFLSELSVAQQQYSESTAFWPGAFLHLSPPDKHGLRSSAYSFSPGRYLHVIQVPIPLTDFPQKAFGAVTEIDAATHDAIVRNIYGFWSFLRSREDYRESATVVLVSGWGAAIGLALDIKDTEAPDDWRFLPISFADAALLGACKDGRLSDVWRILEQADLLEAAGYEISRTNGTLNLVGNWRSTDGQFIPESMLEIDPPCKLVFPTDDLFDLRTEGAINQDLRSVPLPDGSFKVVQRREWGGGYGLIPAYGSIQDISKGILLGCVLVGNAVWWIEVVQGADVVNRAWQLNIWNAILNWLCEAAPKALEYLAANVTTPTRYIRISVLGDDDFISKKDSEPTGVPYDHLSCTSSSEDSLNISIGADWNSFLYLPQNVAEFSLTVFVLEKILASYAPNVLRDEIASRVKEAIPSEDWRWLHAREATKPIERMASNGLVGDFHEIPRSAAALMKCGEIWKFHDRKDGNVIEGEEACGEFLRKYYDFILGELINDVRRFDRRALSVACIDRYQASRHERERWQTSIRAVRSIRGETADAFAMDRLNATNAVQRASKIVCEIAACEAPDKGGALPAREDVDEMYARAILLFGNGQLFSSIRAGLVPPKLHISPAGDLLSDRSVFQQTLVPTTERLNAKILDQAAETYARVQDSEDANAAPEKLPLDRGLRQALESEYACSAEAFVDIQFALVQIAKEHESGVVVAERSALLAMLGTIEGFPKEDVSRLIDRLTLEARDGWRTLPESCSEADFELWRFDRPFSLINRPLVALSTGADPLLAVSPIFVSEAIMYAIGGLNDGHLQSRFWVSSEARAYAGKRADSQGREFEDRVVSVLNEAGFRTKARRNVTELLKMSAKDIGEDLGDVDVVAIDPAGAIVWAIEAKNLRLCRTEVEVAARMTDYRGVARPDRMGRKKPDKLMRHLKRTEFLRGHAERLGQQLQLHSTPVVRGLVVVDAPQPMNFHRLNDSPDSETCMLDDLVGHMRQ